MALKSYRIVITARHKPKRIASECIEVERLRHANAYDGLGVRLDVLLGLPQIWVPRMLLSTDL